MVSEKSDNQNTMPVRKLIKSCFGARRHLRILVIFLLSLSGCLPPNIFDKNYGVAPLNYAIPPAEINDLEKKALLGDMVAARRVAFKINLNSFDPPKVLYWSNIGAENGGIDNRLQYIDYVTKYLMYLSSADEKSDAVLRAIYWARVVLQSNPDDYSKEYVQRFLGSIEFVDDSEPFSILFQKFSLAPSSCEVKSTPNIARKIPYMVKQFNDPNYMVSKFNRISKDRSSSDFSITSGSDCLSEVSALLGNGDAAQSLATHYDVTNHDTSEIFWERIAAEDGKESSQLIYAEQLASSRSGDESLRAVFWAKQVIANSSDTLVIASAKRIIAQVSKNNKL